MLINTITTRMKYENWRFLTCKFLFAAAHSTSPGGVFTQFVMSKVGALQQKIPGVSTPQPLTGPQKFSIRPSPVMVVTPVVSSEPVQVCSSVTAAVTTTTPQVFLENVPALWHLRLLYLTWEQKLLILLVPPLQGLLRSLKLIPALL